MIDLIRYGSLPGIGTFGRLTIGAHTFYTVEQPWDDNKPFKSCIPAGDYYLVPHVSDKYGKTYAICGGTVSHFPDPNFKRYACLFHAANWPSQVQGCVGVGRLLTYINGKLGVTDSRNSVEELKRHISVHDELLQIVWLNPEKEDNHEAGSAVIS